MPAAAKSDRRLCERFPCCFPVCVVAYDMPDFRGEYYRLLSLGTSVVRETTSPLRSLPSGYPGLALLRLPSHGPNV
jgi:hypothetical protein